MSFCYSEIVSSRGGDHFPLFWCGIPHANGYAIRYLIYTSLHAPTPRPPDPRLTRIHHNHPAARHPSIPTSARHPPSHPTAARRPATPGAICNPIRPGPARCVPVRPTPPVPSGSRPPAARPTPSRIPPAPTSVGTTRESTRPLPTRLWHAPASHLTAARSTCAPISAGHHRPGPRPPVPDAIGDACRNPPAPTLPVPCRHAQLPPDHPAPARADRPADDPPDHRPPPALPTHPPDSRRHCPPELPTPRETERGSDLCRIVGSSPDHIVYIIMLSPFVFSCGSSSCGSLARSSRRSSSHDPRRSYG